MKGDSDLSDSASFTNRKFRKEIHMQPASRALGLALLGFGAPSSRAIDPQPLPPRHGENRFKPQPLPPNRVGCKAERVAIDPLPLPPQISLRSPRSATTKRYISETEKNQG